MLMRLTHDDHEHAQHAAHAASTVDRPNRPDYATEHRGAGWLDDNYLSNLWGNYCEIAVAKYLNLRWNANWLNDTVHGLPDVGDCHEVRRLSKPHYGLIVKRKDVDNPAVKYNWACYYDDTNFTVDILGWVNTQRAWELGHICACCQPLNSDTLIIKQRHFNGPDTIWRHL